MRFFISYSRSSDQARLVRDEVAGLARRTGHEVFIDEGIESGEAWRLAIHRELEMCDVGVVLVDEHALRSDWVRFEASVMLHRWTLEDGIVVVPVLLDQTDRGRLAEVGLSQLREWQLVHASRKGMTPGEVADAVVLGFAAEPRQDDPRLRDWVQAVQAILEHVRPAESLRLAALAMGLPPAAADQVVLRGGARYLAHQLLSMRLTARTVDAVGRLSFSIPEDRLLVRLARLLAPTWVDRGAARPLVQHDARRLVAILNAKEQTTARHYIDVATCAPPSGVEVRVVSGAVGEATAAELLAHCEQAVLHLLHCDIVDDPADVPADLLKNGDPTIAAYLVIKPDGAPMDRITEVVETMRSRYHWLIVVLLVGASVPSDETLARWRLADATVLRPPLGAHEEFEGLRCASILLAMADRVSPRNELQHA